MKMSESLNRASKKGKAKKIIGKIMRYTLAFTILLPFTIYYKLKDRYGCKVKLKQYNCVIQKKEKYKGKVLKEILGYMVKRDIPRTVNRKNRSGKYVTREYLIYKNKENEFDDISGDFHLKDFIDIRSYGSKKIYNKKSMKYYNACKSSKESMEYDWFMDKIEEYCPALS